MANRSKKSAQSVEKVLVEAQQATGIVPPGGVPPVAAAAGGANEPSKDWSEEALVKCVKDSVKRIKGYLDSGYVTACYVRLYAALLAMEANRMFGDKTVRQWCEDHQINDTMRSRAKKLHKAFPSSEEAGKMPLPKAIAYANELAGKGKPEATPSEKLGKKLKGLQERLQAILELATAMKEEEVAEHAGLLDQIAEEIESIRRRCPMAVA